MSERPLVSVVVPVHEGERFLGAALDSVLAQDYEPLELIVVDDGSRRRAAHIAHARGAHYLEQANRGPAAARNAGIEASRGSLLAFLDQDDVWAPATLPTRVDALTARPGIGYVLGLMQVFQEAGAPWPHWLDRSWLTEPRVGYCPGTLLVRREALAEVGLFDAGYRSFSDGEWLVRARRAGIEGYVVPEVVLRYRVHEANQSHDRALFRTELVRALRQRRPVT